MIFGKENAQMVAFPFSNVGFLHPGNIEYICTWNFTALYIGLEPMTVRLEAFIIQGYYLIKRHVFKMISILDVCIHPAALYM